MTIQELHYDFKVKADEVDSLSNKEFTDAEIDWLLNEGQLVVIKTRLNTNNPRQKGFEMDQKRIEDLSTLVIRFPNEGNLPLIFHDDLNIYEFNFSNLTFDYLMFLRGRVDVREDSCTKTAEVRLMQTDDIHDALIDPFSKSNKKEVLANIGRATGEGSSLFLYPNIGDALENLKIEYLKYPRRVNLGTYTYIDGTVKTPTTSELPDHMHSELVDYAVKMAVAFVQNPNLIQTSMEKIQTHE